MRATSVDFVLTQTRKQVPFYFFLFLFLGENRVPGIKTLTRAAGGALPLTPSLQTRQILIQQTPNNSRRQMRSGFAEDADDLLIASRLCNLQVQALLEGPTADADGKDKVASRCGTRLQHSGRVGLPRRRDRGPGVAFTQTGKDSSLPPPCPSTRQFPQSLSGLRQFRRASGPTRFSICVFYMCVQAICIRRRPC